MRKFTSIKERNGEFRIPINGICLKDSKYIWLTAYFAKLMVMIRRDFSIEDSVIMKMFDYVTSLQHPDGSFDDLVHIQYYCSQSSYPKSKVRLTAFVVSALLEYNIWDFKTNIDSGVKYLKTHLISNNNVYFDMAIVSYTMALSGKESYNVTVSLLDHLIEEADDSGNLMFWHISKDHKTKDYKESSSVQIETAAYVLLAMIKFEENTEKKYYILHVLKILRWLTLKFENMLGGFYSAHDKGNNSSLFKKLKCVCAFTLLFL